MTESQTHVKQFSGFFLEIFTDASTPLRAGWASVKDFLIALDLTKPPCHRGAVAVPNAPVTLSPEEVGELNKKLALMRHEINNQLALVVAALELIRYRPDLRDKMLDTVAEQTPKISKQIAKFTGEFEAALSITRD